MKINAYHFDVSLLVETLSEGGHDKQVDDEAAEESDGGFDKVVLVGLDDANLLRTINVTSLK